MFSRCYGGIFCCKRPSKLVYKGLENGKNKQQRLGAWTDGGESMFLITDRNRAEVTAIGTMVKSTPSTKGQLIFDVKEARRGRRKKGNDTIKGAG